MYYPKSRVVADAAVPSVTGAVLEIPASMRGAIGLLTVKQTSGTLGGFTYELFRREDAADGTITGHSADSYSITGLQTVAGSASLGRFTTRIPYEVDEVDDNFGGQSRLRKLWLKITPAGTGDKPFEASLTVETAVPQS